MKNKVAKRYADVKIARIYREGEKGNKRHKTHALAVKRYRRAVRRLKWE